MIHLVDTNPAVAVPEAEYMRLLGYPPGHVPGERARELAAWARAWYARHGRPWIHLREVALACAGDTVRLDGQPFTSGSLRDHLRETGATRAVLAVVSAGRTCEEEARRLWEDSRPDEYFFLEIFGSAVVEQLVAAASGRICTAGAHDGLVAVPHYSPGYAGWNVADQPALFHLLTLGRTDALPEPVEVLSSGMLRPKKSLLAVFGLAPSGSVAAHASPCTRCPLTPCAYRRAPYNRLPVRIDGAPPPPAPTAPRYSVNTRALRKWAHERLRLQPGPDGGCTATFRFEGTTCSNMGHPLAFEYRVALDGDADRTILEAACSPATGDVGHTRMCAWIADPGGTARAIAAERPLVGRPLAAVLDWQRPSAPSGCFCEERGRAHKWGLALETIHYALAQAPATPPPGAATQPAVLS